MFLIIIASLIGKLTKISNLQIYRLTNSQIEYVIRICHDALLLNVFVEWVLLHISRCYRKTSNFAIGIPLFKVKIETPEQCVKSV